MEVDMQSPGPSFRTARGSMGYATKRPRSPESPSQERQSKRISLALGDGHFTRRASTVASDAIATAYLPHQDDWVRQARELTIQSPLTVGCLPVLDAESSQSRADEHMAVDHEDSLRPPVQLSMPKHLHSSRSHLPSIQITTNSGFYALTPQPSPAPFSVLTEPPSSTPPPSSPASSLPVVEMNSHPPAIFLFPATPSDTPSLHNTFVSDPDHDTTAHPSSTQAPTLEVPKTEAPSSSARKHRVTMGPRSDCIKCKMGVKGHWMHFD
ncbi:hypothetical protein F5I97DRAFT_2052634 [Phlebopus sp. FC_14]|nr:hypothetical protein F5I97DRAFT_2052634 [Phlebopus sp. FC_14]